MDIRYSTGPQDVKRYTTEELRKEFLIENLYQPDRVTAAYSHVDRMVVLGIMPVEQALPLAQGIDVWANFGTRYFLAVSYTHLLFKKQNMNWAYMNAILKKWHEKGLHTMGEVLSKDSKWRQAAAAGQPDAGQRCIRDR